MGHDGRPPGVKNNIGFQEVSMETRGGLARQGELVSTVLMAMLESTANQESMVETDRMEQLEMMDETVKFYGMSVFIVYMMWK